MAQNAGECCETGSGKEWRSWFFKVWNEPNLDAFLEKADQAASEQIGRLQELTRDLPERDDKLVVPKSGSVEIDVPTRTNDIVLVTLERVRR